MGWFWTKENGDIDWVCATRTCVAAYELWSSLGLREKLGAAMAGVAARSNLILSRSSPQMRVSDL